MARQARAERPAIAEEPGLVTLRVTQEEAALLLSLSRYLLAELLRQQEPATIRPRPAQSASLPLLLTIEQTAEQLGLDRSTVYALVQEGARPCAHIGRAARIPSAALAAYVARLTGEEP